LTIERFEGPANLDFLIEYRSLTGMDGKKLHVLLLIDNSESQQACRRVLDAFQMQVRRLDFVATNCQENRQQPVESAIVAIGHTPPPRRDDRFVARRAWAVDQQSYTFKELHGRLLVCTPRRAQDE
jgi:hypothetical protein